MLISSQSELSNVFIYVLTFELNVHILYRAGTNDANCPHEVMVISNGYDH